jgi:hypothetical protein
MIGSAVGVVSAWLTREEFMRRFRRAIGQGLVALAATFAPVATPPSWAATGSVTFDIFKAGFVVGVGGGSGTLVFNGRRYPLTVGGLSLGAQIGASKASLVGRAYSLRRPADIVGTYTAVGAGAVMGGGASGIRLQNARGVVLELRGRNVGLELNANVSGVEIGMR